VSVLLPIKVGWDYDDVLFPWYDLAHAANIAAGTALPEHEPTSWAPHETYGITLEEWVRVLDNEVLKGLEGMYGEPLDEEKKWMLHRLDVAGFENHIVTARGSLGDLGNHVIELTKTTIDREGLPIKSLEFNRDKPGVVNRLGLHYFIDDAPHNYEALVAGCPNTEVYLLDARWNQDLVVPEGRRLHSVEEYVELILNNHSVSV
jgi:hypothetical protein